MEKLINRKEAAKLLGVSLTTLDEARNSGLITYIQYVPYPLHLRFAYFIPLFLIILVL